MLGKQWLNQYASVDMRGTAVERSQNRQRKLNGIVTWYFDHVMELLPLMLQFALLLLGCALTRHIWGIDITVASVVLGVTSFGVICYTLIVIAGAASVSCPYQTPYAHILRCLWQKVPNPSIFFFTKSLAVKHPDIHLGPEQMLHQEVTTLNFCCISWMLQTSLDRGVNHLTLKFLGSVLMLPGFETTIVDCFHILISCISTTSENCVVVLQGSEDLGETAAACLLGGISHLLILDPASAVLEDIWKQYREVFLPTVDLRNLPFYTMISAIHNLINQDNHPISIDWKDIDPSTPENLLLAHSLVKIAWSHYQRLKGQKKVPHWVLQFSLHNLLQHPNPPVLVVADCLLIIAIGLGCDISEGDVRNMDKRFVYPAQLYITSSNNSLVHILGILHI